MHNTSPFPDLVSVRRTHWSEPIRPTQDSGERGRAAHNHCDHEFLHKISVACRFASKGLNGAPNSARPNRKCARSARVIHRLGFHLRESPLLLPRAPTLRQEHSSGIYLLGSINASCYETQDPWRRCPRLTCADVKVRVDTPFPIPAAVS